MRLRPKKDRFRRSRGGTSRFLDLFCNRCGTHFALYQKDGPGDLLRLYLDRIYPPTRYQAFTNTEWSQSGGVRCERCSEIIGVPMIYEREGRPAIRLVPGALRKATSNGDYPPKRESIAHDQVAG